MNVEQTHPETGQYSFWSWAFIAAAVVIVGYYLLTEHQAHVFAALPWLLILACPLMHMFMGHGGHGNHGRSRREDDQSPNGGPSPSEHHHG